MEPPGPAGACPRAGPTGPAFGRPDGRLRPDPVGRPDAKLREIRDAAGRDGAVGPGLRAARAALQPGYGSIARHRCGGLQIEAWTPQLACPSRPPTGRSLSGRSISRATPRRRAAFVFAAPCRLRPLRPASAP